MSNIFSNCLTVEQFIDLLIPYTNGRLNKSIDRMVDFFSKESQRLKELIENSSEELRPQASALYNSMEYIKSIKNQGMAVIHSFKQNHTSIKHFSSMENSKIYYFEPFTSMIRITNSDGSTTGYPLSSISEVVFL